MLLMGGFQYHRTPAGPLVGVFAAWAVLVGVAALYVAVQARRERAGLDDAQRRRRAGGGFGPASRGIVVALILVLTAGALLRLSDLGEPSISHPEVYVPGLDLPLGISEPPPRHEVAETIWWHFHDEPHPPAYYYLMLGWTELFGTSATSIRMPGVIFGVASILMVFLVAAELFGSRVAIIASAMVGLNGALVFWSQNARMYAMSTFLMLLSVWLLVRISRGFDTPAREVGYLLVTWLGLSTQIFFWLGLAVQLVWTAVRRGPNRGRILQLQALVVMLGIPHLAHALYRVRKSPLESTTLEAIFHYLGFGFALPHSAGGTGLSAGLAVALALLVAVGLRASSGFAAPAGGVARRRLVLWPFALGIVGVLAALGELALRRQGRILALSLVVLVALVIPRLGAVVQRWRGDSDVLGQGGGLALVAFLALAPFTFLWLASVLWQPVLGVRLVLLFIPFLLLLVAVGLSTLIHRHPVGWAAVAMTLGLLAVGAVLYHPVPKARRDYRGFAAELLSGMAEGDLIWVPNRSWETTPLYYYLDLPRESYTRWNKGRWLADPEVERFWYLSGEIEEVTAPPGFLEVTRIGERRLWSVLYARDTGAGNTREEIF